MATKVTHSPASITSRRLSHASTDPLADERGVQSLFKPNSSPEYKEFLIKYILNKGDINIAEKKSKKTVLHFACEACLVEIVLLLLENGANVNVQDAHGKVPLYDNSQQKKVERILAKDFLDLFGTPLEKDVSLETMENINARTKIVELLFSKNADPNIPDNNGMTSLHVACVAGSENRVQLFLNHGANPFLEDCDGRTPLDWARQFDKNSIASLLENFMKNNKHLKPKGCTIL